MSDLVERLERAICRNVNGEPLDDIDRAAVEAAARLRELEALLKPFATAADKADRFIESAKKLGMGTLSESASIGHGLRYRHLFAARQALGGDNG